MQSIEELLKERIQKFKANPKEALKLINKEYVINWNNGVKSFQDEINKERKKDGLSELPFIAIREKLIALKEVDDLRFFYGVCKKYSQTKDKQGNQNTFSKCFFGATKNIK